MKTYLVHHTPKSADQDTWAVSFSVPYIACSYARGGNGLWYIKTWLSAEQIKKRLAILFNDNDELRVQALGREEASFNASLTWLEGRLEADDSLDYTSPPRVMWDALQSAFGAILHHGRTIPPGAAMAATPGSSRAA